MVLVPLPESTGGWLHSPGSCHSTCQWLLGRLSAALIRPPVDSCKFQCHTHLVPVTPHMSGFWEHSLSAALILPPVDSCKFQGWMALLFPECSILPADLILNPFSETLDPFLCVIPFLQFSINFNLWSPQLNSPTLLILLCLITKLPRYTGFRWRL